jgi:hypothetical protein
MKKLIAILASCLYMSALFSQGSTFNQNAAGSNRVASSNWSFDLASGASFGLSNSEKSLFRGNSIATKISGRYQFGWAGLGISGGLIPGSISQPALNSFLSERKIDPEQSSILSSKPSNGYLLLGPSLHFGEHVQFVGQLQGGFFLNDPGSVSITQNGVQRPAYRFDQGSKNLFPGFSGAIQIAYPLNSSTRFFFTGDYLFSRSSIRLLDLQSGIDVPVEQNRNLQLFTAGIGITKTFGGEASNKKHIGNVKYEEIQMADKDHASGLATGRRQHAPAQTREAGSGMATGRRILSPRDVASGMPTGKRYQPGQPVYGNITSREACGTVTQKITRPDGSVEENTFACPADAIEYANAAHNGNAQTKSSGIGNAKSKNNDFGSRVQAGVNNAAGAVASGIGRNIISGTLSRSTTNASVAAIITNNTTRGGSATMNSQTSTKTTNSNSFGTMVRANIYARDVSSGMATGKRSSREAGSGIATGRRQYQPVFFENDDDVCNPCQAGVASNPLYQQNGNAGSNPIFNKTTNTTEQCDGVAGIHVLLLDASTRSIVATTTTETCGEFWFANVPDGNYILRLEGSAIFRKNYTVSTEGSKDIAGELLNENSSWSLLINSIVDTVTRDNDPALAAWVKTRSNIKNDRIASSIRILPVTTTDDDNDGASESIVGGVMPGGAVVSAIAVPSTGTLVKLRKTGGVIDAVTSTNEFGEFEFTGVEAGTHMIEVNHRALVADETALSLGSPQQRGFNQNASRSNHTRYSAENSTDPAPQQRAQNNNTVRSNRTEFKSVLIEADLDGDGEYEMDISNSHAYSLTSNEEGEVAPQQKAGISTSRSNIRSKSALMPVGDGLYIVYGTTVINGKEVSVQSVLKTRHETAKNSISNIR